MKKIFYALFGFFLFVQQVWADNLTLIPEGGKLENDKDLTCNFNTGDFHFGCIPYYIKYLIQGIIALAGTLAVIFIMVGGFKYIFSAVSEEKEAGKETIKNAIFGLIIAGMAWIIVTMVVSLATM